MSNLNKCNLCPRNCNVNRYNNLGFCSESNKLKVARADLYFFEEPCISGKKGSGAIFFSGCNLKCVYCQNYEISIQNKGKIVSIKRLSEIFLELQEKGALNINLVTPTHYILQIKKALIKAKKNGLTIPIIYNSSGYENVNSLKLLDGLIDIYLPDMKYYDDLYAFKYSKCNNYFNICKVALNEMYRQVGDIKFDKNKIIKKGMIVRHMIIPNLTNDSKKILKYLYDTYHDNIYISIMNQYTPNNKLGDYKEINRGVTNLEYNDVINYAIGIGINNAYIQEDGTVDESFIPSFDNTGI